MWCVDFGEVRVIMLSNLSLKPLAACGQILNESFRKGEPKATIDTNTRFSEFSFFKVAYFSACGASYFPSKQQHLSFVLPYTESPGRDFRTQLSPPMPAREAHGCSCHCCCAVELLEPPRDLCWDRAGWNRGPQRVPSTSAAGLHGDGQAVSTEHTLQRLRNGLVVFTCISNPDRENKYAFLQTELLSQQHWGQCLQFWTKH